MTGPAGRFLVLAAALLLGCTKTPPPAKTPEDQAPQPPTSEAPRMDGSEQKPPSEFAAPPDVATAPEGAQRSSTGVAWVVLRPGAGGEAPGPEGRVLVQYTGWTRDGRMFDSSHNRSGPIMLPLDRTIPGFRDGVASMTKGEKRRIWIPAELAYGDAPTRADAPAGPLTFDIELFDIVAAPGMPEDVAAPGPTATVLPSGLAYRVLREGTSSARPTEANLVTVHYTGWTSDGRMFDSSLNRGQPFQFRLSQVIPGWAEGIQHMPVGSIYRFWIPAELAYGEKPRYASMPAGQLTFDVELIAIE
jgi:FKBP-type peptidyl-prolyl cis-trans isomerase